MYIKNAFNLCERKLQSVSFFFNYCNVKIKIIIMRNKTCFIWNEIPKFLLNDKYDDQKCFCSHLVINLYLLKLLLYETAQYLIWKIWQKHEHVYHKIKHLSVLKQKNFIYELKQLLRPLISTAHNENKQKAQIC